MSRITPVASPATANRVLIVDDKRPVRSVLARYFVRHGWIAVEAASSDEALAHIRSAPPGYYDLIVSDVSPAGASGATLYTRASGERPDLRDRFILTTAETAATEIALLRDRFRCPVLGKPLEFGALERTVAEVMEQAAASVAA